MIHDKRHLYGSRISPLYFDKINAYSGRNGPEKLHSVTHGSPNQRVKASHPNFCDRRSARRRKTEY